MHTGALKQKIHVCISVAAELSHQKSDVKQMFHIHLQDICEKLDVEDYEIEDIQEKHEEGMIILEGKVTIIQTGTYSYEAPFGLNPPSCEDEMTYSEEEIKNIFVFPESAYVDEDIFVHMEEPQLAA